MFLNINFSGSGSGSGSGMDTDNDLSENKIPIIDIIFLSMPLIFIIVLLLAILYINLKYCEFKFKFKQKNKEIHKKPVKFNTEFIDNLNKQNKNSIFIEENCSICLDPLKNKKKQVFLNCGHVFHEKCVREWVEKQFNEKKYGDCPNCRDTIIPIINIDYDSGSDTSSLYSDY